MMQRDNWNRAYSRLELYGTFGNSILTYTLKLFCAHFTALEVIMILKLFE